MVDPDPDGRPSAWRTYRKALEETPADATHRLIVQDDAQTCAGFLDAAENAIAQHPERPIVFYVGVHPSDHSRRVVGACQRDLPFAELDYLRWCPVVATSWPAEHTGACVEWYERQRWPDAWVADDEIVGRYLRSIKLMPLATVPSLVEHPDVVRSIVSRRDRKSSRLAVCYIGDCSECDASLIDWTAGVYGHPKSVRRGREA